MLNKSFNANVQVTRIFRTSHNKTYIECLVKDALDEHGVFDERVHRLKPGTQTCLIFPVRSFKVPAIFNNGFPVIRSEIGFGEFGYTGRIIDEVPIDDELGIHITVSQDKITYAVWRDVIQDDKTGIISNLVCKTKNGKLMIIQKVAMGYRNIFVNQSKEE